MSDDARLARAGAGQDENGPVGLDDSFALLWIQ